MNRRLEPARGKRAEIHCFQPRRHSARVGDAEDAMATVILKKGRAKSLRRRHPWVFSGAVAQVQGHPTVGATVDVVDANGHWLGRGAYSPYSQIVVRIWSFDRDEQVCAAFFRKRLEHAAQMRRELFAGQQTNAFRLVHSESDRLPGIVVDRYADYLVCQFTSAGAERWRHEVVAQLGKVIPCEGIFERSDAAIRAREGLQPQTGLLRGRNLPDCIEIKEGPWRFEVDAYSGHKTGFYLDQRANRALITRYAAGASVLNCFAYTGGFCVPALAAGARQVINIEASAAALKLAQQNVAINGLDARRVQNVAGDVFKVLREYHKAGRSFDIVVLDPPKFAEGRGHLKRACRGYKDINRLAFGLLRSGGLLLSFSCSGLMAPTLFQKIVADAALDASREGQILTHLHQAPDHPIGLNFPEGNYLKGLVCRAC